MRYPTTHSEPVQPGTREPEWMTWYPPYSFYECALCSFGESDRGWPLSSTSQQVGWRFVLRTLLQTLPRKLLYSLQPLSRLVSESRATARVSVWIFLAALFDNPAFVARILSNCRPFQLLEIQRGSRYHERRRSSLDLSQLVPAVDLNLKLFLFNDFRATVREDDVTPARTSAVCIVLLLALGESDRESRARIRALLWPDAEAKRANENLRQALYYLRRHFEKASFDGLTVSRTHVSLDRTRVSSDADQLLADITERGTLPQRLLDAPDIAESYLPVFAEQSDTFHDWLSERRTAYKNRLQEALQRLLDRNDISADERRQCANLLLLQNPGDEIACRAMMRLCVARGETAEALRCYNALWTHLENEFDVEPSEQTQSLAVAIKLGDVKADSVSDTAENALVDAKSHRSSLVIERIVERERSSSQATAQSNNDKLWSEIGSHIAARLLPAHRGSLVSSEDDRIVLAFEKTRTAVEAALAIQDFASARFADQFDNNTLGPPLRIAVDSSGEVVYRDHVQEPSASSLIGIVDRGEIVSSVEVKDQITHTLDANVEDLGDHTVAQNDEPVRAYRIHAPQQEMPVAAAPISGQKSRSLLPTIAVIPPTTFAAGDDGMIGEILADEIIAVLSVAQEANIVSRLSSRVFQNRDFTAGEIGKRLHANYVVSGRYREIGSNLLLDLELIDTRTEQVVWSERKSGLVTDFISPDHGLIMPLSTNIVAAVMNFELQQSFDVPMPTLESYTLLVSAITLMHRLSVHAFDRAREMLEILIERMPDHSVPHAWLGYWHVMRVQQGWFENLEEHKSIAISANNRALDLNPASSLALTIRGVICTSLLHRLDDAETCLLDALQSNPNQSLAWLQKSCVHAFRGEGELALDHAQQALQLTPLHPLRYLYDSLAGTAALAAHRFDQAEEFAKRSLMVNRTHTSTLRLLAVAQWNLGNESEARRTGRLLLSLEPSFTVSSWRARTPSNNYKIGDEWAHTLRQLGIPE